MESKYLTSVHQLMPPRAKSNQKLEGGRGSQKMQFGDTDQEREEWRVGIGGQMETSPTHRLENLLWV